MSTVPENMTPPGRFDVLAFVVTTNYPPGPNRYPAATNRLAPGHRQILERAREPVSVAELGGQLNLSLGRLRTLLSDLVDEGLVVVHEPTEGAFRPAEDVLEAVIDGLRAL